MPYKDPTSERAKASQRERARRYYQGEKGRKRHAEYELERYRANREAILARRRARKNPDGKPVGRPRTKADDRAFTHAQIYNLVSEAIKDGRLVRQPCEACGARSTHAHHDDYARPLDVRWLCPKHHSQHHRELKNAKT